MYGRRELAGLKVCPCRYHRPASRHFLLTSANLCLKKFTERVARLVSDQLVELKVMPEIRDRRLKARKIKSVIGVGINYELDRHAFTLLSRNPQSSCPFTNFRQASAGVQSSLSPVRISAGTVMGPLTALQTG